MPYCFRLYANNASVYALGIENPDFEHLISHT